ncbi:MAG: hypothetical protein ACR2QC_08320 [Gammaproteobacteria bacterium]
MFHLLYQAVAVAVHGMAHSFRYAAPFMAAAAVAVTVYRRGDLLSPSGSTLLAAAVFFVFGPPYISAVLHIMLHGKPPPFMRVLRWQWRDLDFLLFMAGSFLFGGMLILFVADVGMSLGDYAALRESPETETEAKPQYAGYGYGEGATIVVVFGSRAFAAGFFLAALWLWGYFFRAAVRIPAYMDGYDLRTGEAMTATRNHSLQIVAVSLLINVGLSVAAVSAPWSAAEWWLQAVMAGVSAWAFLHFNLALSVAMYQEYTAGYSMRLLRH